MDLALKRRKLVREILESILIPADAFPPEEYRQYIIEDSKTGHFLLFTDGWKDDEKRFYGCSVHIQVTDDGKVHLLYEMTDHQIGQKLLDRGVRPNELVPAFQPPNVREEMGFAVA